jgi:hypothetical protein
MIHGYKTISHLERETIFTVTTLNENNNDVMEFQRLPFDTECTPNGPQWPINRTKVVTCDEIRKVIASSETRVKMEFPQISERATFLLVDDVAECWPNCTIH